MMYPRLELLCNFLAENGSIWVSIDDNESHYLKVMLDELFGRKNFLTSFVWKKSYGGGAKSKWYVGLHEFVLCYTKNKAQFPDMFLPPDPEAVKKYYKHVDNKSSEKGPYRLQPLATTSMDARPNLRYPIVLPSGEEIWPEKQWQWSKNRVHAALANDEILITRKLGNTTVSYKQYLKDDYGEERKRKPSTIIDRHYTQHGTYEAMDLFGLEEKFSFPKPEGLIRNIFEAATKPGDLVLDSFIGSGTTAAVAHKMGRRYIGIEMGDHAKTHCAFRLRKVIHGEQGGISEAVGWNGGGGFRFYQLGNPIFDEQGRIAQGIHFAPLAAHLWFAETGSAFSGQAESPLLGENKGTAYYLLYNGILGDKRPNGGNVLTARILAALPAFDGPKVVFGEGCRLGPERLRQERITFRQIPYEIKAR